MSTRSQSQENIIFIFHMCTELLSVDPQNTMTMDSILYTSKLWVSWKRQINWPKNSEMSNIWIVQSCLSQRQTSPSSCSIWNSYWRYKSHTFTVSAQLVIITFMVQWNTSQSAATCWEEKMCSSFVTTTLEKICPWAQLSVYFKIYFNLITMPMSVNLSDLKCNRIGFL